MNASISTGKEKQIACFIPFNLVYFKFERLFRSNFEISCINKGNLLGREERWENSKQKQR